MSDNPILIFLTCCILMSCGLKEQAGEKTLPNILFIAVDDLRPELNCYGKSHIHSPNIDKLASRGVIFNRNYCQVPVCGASRASLLSGTRPTADRFVDFATRLDEDFPGIQSLPEYLKNQGYTTLSRGKIFHHANDQLDAWSETPWSPASGNPEYGWFDYADTNSLAIIKRAWASSPDSSRSRVRGPAFEYPDVEDSVYRDGKLALKGIQDLERLANDKKPFFLAIGFWKPHLPFNAPKKYWDLYNINTIPTSPNPFIPEDAPKNAIHNSGELRNYGLIPHTGPVSRDTAKLLTQGYYACISYTDAQIGKLLDAMDRLKLTENTIVVLWGDHGWNLEDHTLWCKHANFETSMRAPLIISAPGRTQNATSNALTEFVDIYPTICDLAGLKAPEHLDGMSLTPLLDHPDQTFKDFIFSRFHQGESIKTTDFVYTEWIDPKSEGTTARMLYDHRVDSLENKNVVDDPKYADIVKKLSTRLLERRNASALKKSGILN
ncbi:MAG: sulfatase [Saprospiraceae bacterium]|nr:sulfatase [Saprospiraceae bacterium]